MNADFSHTCEGCEHVVTEPSTLLRSRGRKTLSPIGALLPADARGASLA